DYEGLISGDGDLPAPSAHWQPPSPEATPWDIIHAAPNQSKPTPISPFEPETHRNCNICAEIRRLQGIPAMHPHLQPVVNPYCKFNRPGCQGPASDSRCISCDTVYLANPRKYNRARPRPDRPSEYSQDPSVPSLVESLPEPQPRPNPLPEQFPDNDPMLNGYIDPNASTESAFLYPVPCTPLLKVIPQTYYPPTPFPATKPPSPNQGGTPRHGNRGLVTGNWGLQREADSRNSQPLILGPQEGQWTATRHSSATPTKIWNLPSGWPAI
ncbi:MAG: hypothetical protein WBW84_22235, partial [Acidobacteriaceae bacterium]